MKGGALGVLILAAPTIALGRPPRAAVAVLAGGCYWGVESVFRHVRGVRSATSGYAAPVVGDAGPVTPAEAVRIVYDPTRVTYRQILDVFFLVAHDPTQWNRQGPDSGAEYRSMVFVESDRHRAEIQAVIDSLTTAHVYPGRIVTEIAVLRSFQAAGDDQQNYTARHPSDPYVAAYDAPRVEALRRRFPQLYRN